MERKFNMQKKNRSRKAKEAHAEYLLKVSVTLFIFCEVCLFYISDLFRERAYDIYDQIYPDRFNKRVNKIDKFSIN